MLFRFVDFIGTQPAPAACRDDGLWYSVSKYYIACRPVIEMEWKVESEWIGGKGPVFVS